MKKTQATDMNLRPLHDRVILKRVESKDITEGGIIIPDAAKEKPTEAIVMAAGNGRVLEDGSLGEMSVKAGDRVLFGKYTGTEITYEGEKCLVMRETDILAVLEGAAA